ncbi:MAG: type II toxin-antitoxin system PemK/MazF family toxin [Candidatus Micrarchaeota archaeon]|nr:type II toxin-antitoxin system PemK/MazF family toxin [Candidatus Micrarchaeota archaeon]
MQQGDLVWVKVPFSNFEEEKMRPALIVSNDEYNASALDVVVCAVTSNLEQVPYSVMISQKSLAGGFLPIQSKIRADKLFQLEKSKIVKPFAKLRSETFNLVVEQIAKLVSRKS